MNEILQDEEKRVARSIQGDIPAAERPFQEIGERIGLTEQDVLKAVRRLVKARVIRKFGAIVRHRKAGFTRNAMIIWAVPQSRCESVGRLFASYPQITHCYQREPAFEGRYNIFCMAHFSGRDDEELIRELSEAASIRDCKVLFSEEEFKKSSMEYF
jgi:DNA-binding Lrp family transcriptional regulator